MTFTNESDFEKALIEILSTKGWEKDIITYPSEEDLLKEKLIAHYLSGN